MAGNDRYTLEFGGALLPAMLHAVMIERNSSMMDGHHEMTKVLEAQYQALLVQAGIPDLLTVVDDARWFNACTAMRSAKEYHWFTESGWNKPGNVSLIVDGKERKLAWDLPEDAPHIEEIKAFVERYAHVAAVKGEPETHWKSYEDMLRARAKEAAGPAAEPTPAVVRAEHFVGGAELHDEDDEEFADDHDPDGDDEDLDGGVHPFFR